METIQQSLAKTADLVCDLRDKTGLDCQASYRILATCRECGDESPAKICFDLHISLDGWRGSSTHRFDNIEDLHTYIAAKVLGMDAPYGRKVA